MPKTFSDLKTPQFQQFVGDMYRFDLKLTTEKTIRSTIKMLFKMNKIIAVNNLSTNTLYTYYTYVYHSYIMIVTHTKKKLYIYYDTLIHGR